MSLYSCTLKDVLPGERCVVKELTTKGSMHRRLLDIGIVGGTVIECVGTAPMGDPSAYRIRGAVIAIRDADCEGILVKKM